MDPSAHQSACDSPGDSPGPIRSWHAERSALSARHDQALTRIDAPAPDILRVRCAPAGRLAARRSWDPAAELPGAALSVQEDGIRLRLCLPGMTASLALDSGALALTTPGGTRLCADLTGARWRTADPAEVADWTQTGDAADPACGAAALPAGTAQTGCSAAASAPERPTAAGAGSPIGHWIRVAPGSRCATVRSIRPIRY
jgi:hypothetical protein